MDIVNITFIAAFTIFVWLNILATLAIKHDSTLERHQKRFQTVIVWLIPFFGASTVLYLINEHYSDAIPQAWVPWPFKKVIFGKPIKPNQNRDDLEDDYGGGRSHNRDNNDGGFNDT